MMNFDNDLALYPDEFDVATEGLGDAIKSGLGKLKQLGLAAIDQIKRFGAWIKSKIDALIAWGKQLKEEAAQKKEETSDETAKRYVSLIRNDINTLADQMIDMLDIVAELKAEARDAQNDPSASAQTRGLAGPMTNGGIAKCYSLMNEALKDSAKTVSMIKELPRIKMTYKGTAETYLEMKKLSDKNSKMATTVDRINKAKEDGTVDAKEKCLSKFIGIHQKLQACTKALLNKLVGMSGDDSAVAKKMKQVDNYNDNHKKSKNYIDEVDSSVVDKDINSAAKASVKIVANKLDNAAIIKANGGKKVNANAWINYIKNKVKKDADENPHDLRKQKLWKTIDSDETALAKYVASVTNTGNIKKWAKADESVDGDSSFDFDAILYDNIKESVLEDMYFEANESANAAFAGLDDSDDFDALTSL